MSNFISYINVYKQVSCKAKKQKTKEIEYLPKKIKIERQRTIITFAIHKNQKSQKNLSLSTLIEFKKRINIWKHRKMKSINDK
jgi:hypothetical protein